MKPHNSSYPMPRTAPRDGKDRGNYYQYRGEKPFPQRGEKPKK